MNDSTSTPTVSEETPETIQEALDADYDETDDDLSLGDDIELDIRESIEELSQKGGTSDENETTVKNAARDEKAQRARDAKGRFSQKTEADDNTPRPGEAPEAQTPEGTPKEGLGRLEAPNTWSREDKEWFNAQPVEAQRAYHARHIQQERKFHEITQREAQREREFQDLNEVVRPYEKSWALQKISRAEGFRNLAAANDLLNENLHAGLDYLARSKGKTLRQVVEEIERGDVNSQVPFDIEKNSSQVTPEMIQNIIRQELLSINGQRDSNATKEKVISEFRTIQNETDQFGRYLYPELHDEQFRSELGPAVELLAKSPRLAQLSPRELLLRAYSTLSGKQIPSRAVAATNTTQNGPSRTASAALSRRTGSPAPKPRPDDVPDDVGEHLEQVAREFGWQF